MTLKERYEGCLAYWQEQNPNPGTELNYSNNFELLVAVMLSAQCTDKRINMVTPALFAAYPTAEGGKGIVRQHFLTREKRVVPQQQSPAPAGHVENARQ